MPRIAILDTYYEEFLRTWSPLIGSYETELQKLLAFGFGTFDAYSFYLRQEGWEALDIIANFPELQKRWATESLFRPAAGLKSIALQQIHEFKPDVLFLQNLGYFDAADLEHLSKKYLLAGQISCALPEASKVSKFAVLFTSFPFYVDRLKSLGVPTVEYLPLAFDPRMLSEESPDKQYDISFVGGVGKNSHWKAGTEMLERVAAEFKERFVWFGYGRENLEAGSPLHACYRGPAWGREMYRIYGRSKIVVNRHGEVAEGYSNNLRMYEATGMCALLYTEESTNLETLFPFATVGEYESTDDLLHQMHRELAAWSSGASAAKKAQQHTLQHHTYAHRMKVVSDVLTAALVGQAA